MVFVLFLLGDRMWETKSEIEKHASTFPGLYICFGFSVQLFIRISVICTASFVDINFSRIDNGVPVFFSVIRKVSTTPNTEDRIDN